MSSLEILEEAVHEVAVVNTLQTEQEATEREVV
jgi:hypothetical protein